MGMKEESGRKLDIPVVKRGFKMTEGEIEREQGPRSQSIEGRVKEREKPQSKK